jgi:hypothetical protein
MVPISVGRKKKTTPLGRVHTLVYCSDTLLRALGFCEALDMNIVTQFSKILF